MTKETQEPHSEKSKEVTAEIPVEAEKEVKVKQMPEENGIEEIDKDIPQYNPKKQYQWEPTATFTVDAPTFGLILNTIRTALDTPEARKIHQMLQANERLEGIMAHGVAKGVITEIPEGPQRPTKR